MPKIYIYKKDELDYNIINEFLMFKWFVGLIIKVKINEQDS